MLPKANLYGLGNRKNIFRVVAITPEKKPRPHLTGLENQCFPGEFWRHDFQEKIARGFTRFSTPHRTAERWLKKWW